VDISFPFCCLGLLIIRLMTASRRRRRCRSSNFGYLPATTHSLPTLLLYAEIET